MRVAGWLCLTASLALISAADDDAATGDGTAAEEDTDNFADLDLDMEAEDAGSMGSMPYPGGAGGAAEAVEDFDLGMPEEDRRKRMKACLIHTTNRVQLRRDMLEQTIRDMVEQHNMKQEQAINALLVTWQMSCYMNIRSGAVSEARRGGSMSEELEQELFSQRSDWQNVQQASQRQWKLLESVLAEMQKEAGPAGLGSQPDARASPGAAGAAGAAGAGAARPAPDQSQWIYVLLVFGVFFGTGALVISRLRLLGKKEETERERSSKSQRKAEKAEKKLARKRIA